MKKLNVCYHTNTNCVDVYYAGEEPGSPSDSRAFELEDEIMEWAEIHFTMPEGHDGSPSSGDIHALTTFIERAAKRIIPYDEINIEVLE